MSDRLADDVDPLDQVRARGWRIAWLQDSAADVIICDDEQIAIVDPSLTRQEIWDLLKESVLA